MKRRTFLLAVACATLLAACGDDEVVVHPYDAAPVPAVPDRSHELTDPPADPLPDGQYWATGATASGDAVTFSLALVYFGPGCDAALGADRCTDGYGVDDTVTADVTAPAATLAYVTVVDTDRRNYAVPATELVRLVGGAAPDAKAPSGFAYQPYPYLVDVRGGVVVQAQQVWVP